MGVLKNLDGVSAKEVEEEFISKPSDIRTILRKGKAATDADDNGAINIWRDDDGYIRCQAMRYMRTIEEKKYNTLKEAEAWTKKWIEKIK